MKTLPRTKNGLLTSHALRKGFVESYRRGNFRLQLFYEGRERWLVRLSSYHLYIRRHYSKLSIARRKYKRIQILIENVLFFQVKDYKGVFDKEFQL